VIEFRKTYTNTVTVTLTENATISNPIYLFLFKNQQSGVNYYFIATDTSAFKQRYNQFQVIEKANANTLNGEVSLDNEGFYDYTIYQTSIVNPTEFRTRVLSDNGTFEAYTCYEQTILDLYGITTASDAVQYITKTLEVGLVWVVPDELQTTDYNPLSTTTIIYNPE
jgi:hypothetical protein